MSIPNTLPLETPLVVTSDESDPRLVAIVQQASLKINSLKRDLASAGTQIGLIQVEMTRLQGMYTEMVRLKNEALLEASTLTRRIDEFRIALTEASENKTVLNAQISGLSIELESANEKVINLTDQASQYQKQILALNTQLIQVVRQLEPKRSWRKLPLIRSLSESTQNKLAFGVKSVAALAGAAGLMALGAYIEHKRQEYA